MSKKNDRIIREKVKAVEAELNVCYAALSALQASCPHNGVTKTPKSDTGNWCHSDDSYWYHCECPVCGKVWTEDQ